MSNQARYVPNEHPTDKLELKATLEAAAEGCEVEAALVLEEDEKARE